ncbi:ABC transporter substrate-binding protein [Thermodesulfobacteriota bacterium]
MKTRWYFLVMCLMAVWVFPDSILLAAEKPVTVAELALYKGADRQQILEAGARKEGKLTFYTSGILKQAVRPVVNAFEKKYPFIKVQIWRASSSTVIARLTEEYAGRKKIGDVIEGTQTTFMFLQKHKIAQSFYSPNIVNMVEEAMTKAPKKGFYAVAFRGSGISLGYNTKLISEEELPKTYEDLLDPKWKGKMTVAGSYTGTIWLGTMLHVYGEDFVKKMAQQDFDVHMVSGRAVLDMIIAGEYIFSPTIYDSHAINSKNQGAPVDWVPLEPVPTNIGQIALLRNSPNPHAAMLFVDFELTKKSAEIHKSAGYSTFHKDVPVLKVYKKYFGAEDMQAVKRQQELFSRFFLKK